MRDEMLWARCQTAVRRLTCDSRVDRNTFHRCNDPVKVRIRYLRFNWAWQLDRKMSRMEHVPTNWKRKHGRPRPHGLNDAPPHLAETDRCEGARRERSRRNVAGA